MSLLLVLRRSQMVVAQKQLVTDSDFRRVSNADTLQYRDEPYGFSGIAEGMVIFEHRPFPVIVDGFVTPV